MGQGLSWIAIVDDEPSVLKSLSRTLRVHAYETKIFKSAYDFLAAFSDGTPACLILYVMMPGMTGPELHHRLIEANIHIPTIVITAHDGDQEWAHHSDIIAILSKPLQNSALFDAITIALRPDRNATNTWKPPLGYQRGVR